MSATTASPGATQTAPPPSLVTQFSQPSECTDLFRLVSEWTLLETYANAPARNQTTSVFTSDSNNSRFSSCQPSGWDKAHFTFSPGLCPSGWIYNELKAMTTSTATVSQAYCCAPDYHLQVGGSDDTGMLQCKEVKFDGDQSETRLHDAWFIKWQSSDKLPVSLPDLPTAYTVAAWQPGQSATLTPLDGHVPDHSGFNDIGSMVAVIVIPVVVVLLATGFCVFCIRRERKRKRQQREQVALQELTGEVGKDGVVNQ